MAINGVARQPEPDEGSTGCWRGAQQAQSFRVAVEDLIDESGQHRDRAAEQDGKHVECQRSENDLACKHKPKAFDDTAPDGCVGLAHRLRVIFQQHQRPDPRQGEQARGKIGERQPRPGDQTAAERRPCNLRHLENDRANGRAPRKILALQGLRKQHLVRWTDEGARQPRKPDTRINHGLRAEPRSRERAQRDGHHQCGDQHVNRTAHDRDHFLGHHVDRMPGEQRHTEVRHNLGQSNEPERQRIAGDVVDVPAHRDRKNLVA